MIENTKVLSAGIDATPYEADPTVPQHVKQITQEDIDRWNTPCVESDTTVPIWVKNIRQEDIDKWNSTPTIDYTTTQNKPTINGTEVSGNVTLEQIGAQPAGNYATKEEVTQMITDSVADALGGSY